MNKIYRIVVSLKYDLKELLSKVDRLENQGKYINHDELGDQSDDAVLWNFPITTVNEVLLFEKKLQDKTFRFKIVSILICSYYYIYTLPNYYIIKYIELFLFMIINN